MPVLLFPMSHDVSSVVQSFCAPHAPLAPLIFQSFTKTVVTQIKLRQQTYKKREQSSVMHLPYEINEKLEVIQKIDTITI